MKHNSYFEAKVQSLSISTTKGNATVGVIEPGKYTFNTATEETMKVVSGLLRYKIAGKEWQTAGENVSFVVPEKSSFDVEAVSDAAYICYYK
jgi:uncharacterized protein YaiE (UPF0345 family)